MSNFANFTEDYFEKLRRALTLVPLKQLEILASEISSIWNDGRQLYIFGNGGSAGNATHLANDYLYGIGKKKTSGLKVHALPANTSILTCLANDEGYAKIFVEQYNTKGGREYFISYESHDRVALFGFIRLRLPNSNHNPVMSAIKNMALIRELHVYGQVKAVGSKISKSKAQHKGIGKKLISKAEMIAMKNLYKGVAIISGEGVKSYYEDYKFYIEKDTYMIKYFTDIYLLYFGIFLVFIGILMIIIY